VSNSAVIDTAIVGFLEFFFFHFSFFHFISYLPLIVYSVVI